MPVPPERDLLSRPEEPGVQGPGAQGQEALGRVGTLSGQLSLSVLPNAHSTLLAELQGFQLPGLTCPFWDLPSGAGRGFCLSDYEGFS